MTQGELQTCLDKAADILRGNAGHSGFRGCLPTLWAIHANGGSAPHSL